MLSRFIKRTGVEKVKIGFACRFEEILFKLGEKELSFSCSIGSELVIYTRTGVCWRGSIIPLDTSERINIIKQVIIWARKKCNKIVLKVDLGDRDKDEILKLMENEEVSNVKIRIEYEDLLNSDILRNPFKEK